MKAIITSNNIVKKISLIGDLSKRLAELELNLKLLFEASGIFLYRDDGGAKFKNMCKMITAFKNHIATQSNQDDIFIFWEKYQLEVEGFVELRNTLIHGNLYQALTEKLIEDKDSGYVVHIDTKVISPETSKCVRDLIVTFADEARFEKHNTRLDEINNEIHKVILNYLSTSTGHSVGLIGI